MEALYVFGAIIFIIVIAIISIIVGTFIFAVCLDIWEWLKKRLR